MTAIFVRGLSFDPDGSITLEYADAEKDVREKGIILNHTLFIPSGQDYDDELQAVVDAVGALLADVLEDLPHLAPVQLVDDDDDEDEDDALERRPYDRVDR